MNTNDEQVVSLHPEGTVVRVIGKSVSGDPALDGGSSDVGDERIVYDYAGPGEGDDPNERPYYLLDTETSIGGAEWAYPEHLEVVKTAAEQAARQAPSLRDLTAAVSSSLHHGWGDVVEVDQTYPGDDGSILTYGRAANGLRIAFRVRVDQIEVTDL